MSENFRGFIRPVKDEDIPKGMHKYMIVAVAITPEPLTSDDSDHQFCGTYNDYGSGLYPLHMLMHQAKPIPVPDKKTVGQGVSQMIRMVPEINPEDHRR